MKKETSTPIQSRRSRLYAIRRTPGPTSTTLAEPLGRRSKFSRDVGGPLVGGVDIMMSPEPRTVVHLACSPLLHYAFRVAKLRGCRGDDGNRIELYGSIRDVCADAARARGRLAPSCITARDERIAASCCTAVIATTRVRGSCAALHDAGHP